MNRTRYRWENRVRGPSAENHLIAICEELFQVAPDGSENLVSFGIYCEIDNPYPRFSLQGDKDPRIKELEDRATRLCALLNAAILWNGK